MADRICELRVDDIAIWKGNWERSIQGRASFIDTKSNHAEEGHGQNIEPCESHGHQYLLTRTEQTVIL